MAPPAKESNPFDGVPSTSLTHREVVDFDPNGDMFIEVQDSWTLVRVSKQRLSDFSPVFKTMLGPIFAEGQRVHSADNPLKLPDDDIFCMGQILSSAHSCYHAGSLAQQDCLGSMIIMCDKYKCTDPFRFHLDAVLRGWASGFSRYGGHAPDPLDLCTRFDEYGNPRGDTDDETDHEDNDETDDETDGNNDGVNDCDIDDCADDGTSNLIWLGVDANEMLAGAFLLDNDRVFAKILHQIFRQRDSRYLRAPCNDEYLEALLPDWYREGLVHAHTKAMDRVRESLYKPLDDLLAEYTWSKPCSAKTQLIALCSCAIYKDELLPDRCSDPPRNYLERNWTHYVADMESEVNKCSSSCCESKPSQRLEEVQKDVLRALGKVCLKCFKNGKYGAVVGSCEHTSDD